MLVLAHVMDTLPTLQPISPHPFSRKQVRFQEPDLLSAVEEKILCAVYKLPYLRIDQLVRFLGYEPTSLEWVRKKVKALVAREYLDIQPLPRLTSYGVLPHLFILGTHGITFFQEKGYPVFYHSPKERLRSYGHITHALRVSEVILAALCLSRFAPEIELIAFHHDLRIKHTPICVTVDNKPAKLNPDAILDCYLAPPFGTPGADRFTCFVEVDNDEEDCSQLTPKIAKYVSFLEQQIVAHPFGFQSINAIAFLVCSGGLRRVRLLKTWIQTELDRLGKLSYAKAFQIAPLPLLSSCALPMLYLSPVFYSVDAETPAPLIAKLL